MLGVKQQRGNTNESCTTKNANVDVQCAIRSDSFRNEYIKKSLGVTNMTGKISENILRWFGYVERKNNDEILKKIGELRVERNQEWSRQKGELYGSYKAKYSNMWSRYGQGQIDKIYEQSNLHVWDKAEDKKKVEQYFLKL